MDMESSRKAQAGFVSSMCRRGLRPLVRQRERGLISRGRGGLAPLVPSPGERKASSQVDKTQTETSRARSRAGGGVDALSP